MKINVKKYQMGGEVAPTEAAPAEQTQGAGPEEQVAAMAQQIISELGPQMSALLAQMIMQMLQELAARQPQGQPVYAKKGGKLTMIGRK